MSFVFAKEAFVKVKSGSVSDWKVDRMLFGRFFEHHGCDVYPGIYEQYIVNPSFEKYYRKGKDSPTPRKDVKPRLVFDDIPQTEGLAYPWEPHHSDTAVIALSTEAFNSDVSQRITCKVADSHKSIGIKQKLALPDYRTGQYKVAFHAKSLADGQTLAISIVDYGEKKILDSKEFSLSSEWQLYSDILDIGSYNASIRHADRHGVFYLIVSLKDSGDVFIDQMTLFPTDAVEGKWNSEAIENIKQAGITVIRWPGGNFASGYHWEDGVGPLEKRPTRPNLAWAGQESNHVGTNEFLRFCELTDMTPLICVGFDTCTPEEAANWIQYCNGSIATQYGKLRAEHGHPQPYNVKLWQVGNEVYGWYQIGHTNAKDYATRYLDYYDAMKKADPNISIMSMGRDPGYHTNDDNAWNKTLFSIIGNKMDYIDIHRYVRGVRNQDDLKTWDKKELAEIYLSYPSQYDVIVESIRQIAKDMNLHDVKLAVTEWGQYLTLSTPELPDRFSQANAVFYAGMMNCFIRHSDFVAMSCSHDFSVFGTNRFRWNVPVLPRSYIAKLYAEVDTDRLLQTEVICDTYDLERKITQMITLDDIPYIDVVALGKEGETKVSLFIVNRSVHSDCRIHVDLDGVLRNGKAEVLLFTAKDDPMASQTWANPRVFKTVEETVIVKDGKFEVDSPMCSVVRIIVDNSL